MADIELRGAALHERLMELKPKGLPAAEWLRQANLGRTWLADLKKPGDKAPRIDNLERLLAVAGHSLADLQRGASPAPPPSGPITADQIAKSPRNIPILGTAQGASVKLSENGRLIDVYATMIDREPIGFGRRPPSIEHNRHVYIVLTEGDSMEPRYRHGDPIYVDSRREPGVGEDCIVQLARQNGEYADSEMMAVLIKELARRTATHIELRQFNPELTFTIDKDKIAAIHRVIPWRELLW